MQSLPQIPFTKEGLEKVNTEIALLEKKRAEILIRLQAAREMGDLSENGAYKAARFELGDTDRRLRQLLFQSRFGYIAPKSSNGTVAFGSDVTLESNGQTLNYKLVNQYESDPAKQKISVDSPLGRKLLGKKPGEVITLTLPQGTQEYQIKAIK